MASESRVDNARETLRVASTAAGSSGMWLHHHVAKRRIGELTGGERGATMVAEADAWMRDQGIRRPDRMSEVIAPGFSSVA